MEDFHYLPEDEKRKFARDLKAFWDQGVYFLIAGIWAEQNLLVYYNGDLAHRVEEIDVQWTNDELAEVLAKGESALNVTIEAKIKTAMISDALNNVGLLQAMAENFCVESGVMETSSQRRTLSEETSLKQCRSKIAGTSAQRYRNFMEVMNQGFRQRGGSELRVYQHIVHAFMEGNENSVMIRIQQRQLLATIQTYEPRIRVSDLTQALKRINRLQEERGISPIVISYNLEMREIQLTDRELLFYRKYGNPTWPWAEA